MISGPSIKYLSLIVTAILMMQCTREEKNQASISYPQPLPDSVAMPFLPGIVSSDSLDFNSAFSLDGKCFYFSRSSKGKWMIYMTELREGSWGKPVLAPFTETEYSQADPFISGDGTLYYISNRPRHRGDTIPDYDIWLIRPRGDGSWTEPENPEGINSDSTEYYVSRSANGNLYFASNRAGTLGSHDIYVSRYVDGVYTAPQNLGSAINSEQMEHDPMISPDEQYLVFTSVDRADSYGSGDLYYSLRNGDGTWTPAKNMGRKFNTNTYEYCTYITPDGHYLFYSTDYDVKWIGARHFPWTLHSKKER
jgi:Tol biopolymer transport system component